MLVAKLVSAVEEEMELPEGSMGCMPRNKQTTQTDINRRHGDQSNNKTVSIKGKKTKHR